MAYVRICDLCHEEIKESDKSRKFKIKIKEMKNYVSFTEHMAWCDWENIDAHSVCVMRLFEKTNQKDVVKNDT